jgi:CO/xanthine dehydrogenase Mo-binding subunit
MNFQSNTKTDFKVIGTRVPRPDGVDKVTGRALYGADYNVPGMQVGLILRSPHAHATIDSIDVSAAAALPGVKAVITSADLGIPEDEGLRDVQDNCLARGKVLYDGHAIAAVAATKPSISSLTPFSSWTSISSIATVASAKHPSTSIPAIIFTITSL